MATLTGPTKEQRDAALLASGLNATQQNAVVTPTYSTNNLAPTTPLTVPTPPAVTPAPVLQATTTGSADSLAEIIKTLQTPSAVEADSSTARTQIMETLAQLSGKGTKQAELEAQAKIPEQTRQLNELNLSLQALNKEALAAQLQAERSGETLGFVRGEQGEIERQRAIKALTLSAQAQIIQGNIGLAQAQVSRALDLEYEPLTQKLTALKQFYEFNKDTLDREDKKRADNLNLLISERNRILADEKANREQIYKTGVEVSRYGADQTLVQKIFNSKTREEADALASPFLSKEYLDKRTKEDEQLAISRRNVAVQEAQQKLLEDKFAFEKEQKKSDLTSGTLTEGQLKSIDTSPQGKKIISLGDLKTKLSTYQGLLKEYGTASYGQKKAELQSAYSNLKIAYKTAADLGAIQTPDVPIIEGALREATYYNPLTQAFSKITGNTLGAIEGGLTQTEKAINSSAQQVLTELLARDPQYQNSDYVKALALPFIEKQTGAVNIKGQSVTIGSTIQSDDGKQYRVNSDGSLSPI